MWLFFNIIWILLIHARAQISEVSEDYSENIKYSCIVELLNVFKGNRPTDVTLTNSNNLLHKELSDINNFRIISRSFVWSNDTVHNRVYIISSDTIKELEEGLISMRHDFYWNPTGIFIIDMRDENASLKYVSNLLRHYNIYNVSVILKSNAKGEDNYNVYGFAAEIDACNRPKTKSLKFLTKCSEFKSDNVFTIKISSKLRDCNLKILAREQWPYTCYPKTNCLGLDQYVLDLWKESNNVTIETVFVSDNKPIEAIQEYLDYHPNDTVEYDGFMGGHILFYERAILLDFAYPYLIDHNIVIVARAPFLGKWEVIIRQFTLQVFLLICFLFIIFCFIVTYLSIFKSKIKDIIRDIVIVYGYFVNNVSLRRLNSQFAVRIIFLCLLIFVFLLSNIIQAFLLSASTHPIRDKQVKEINEVFKNFYPVIYFPHKPKINFSRKIVNCSTSFECVTQVVDGKNMYKFTVVSEIYYNLVTWLVLDDNNQLMMYRLPEPADILYRVTYFHRGSTLRAPFNNHLRKVMSSGLLSRRLDRLVQERKLKSKIKEQPAYLPNSLADMKEPFIVLLVGYAVSITVFIFEYRSKRN